MILIAWRGGLEGGKENTIKAIKFSLKYSEIIEVDVRMTKDNILVLTHSPLINQKKIKDSEWDEVRDKIEKLEDTIPLVLDKGKRLMIDIKQKKIESRILDLIKNFEREKIIINSLQKDVLFRVRNLDQTINISIGFTQVRYTSSYVKKLIEKLRPYCVTPHKKNAPLITLLKKLRAQHHFLIFPWLIERVEEVEKIKYADGIVTPFPKTLFSALKYHKMGPPGVEPGSPPREGGFSDLSYH